MEAWIGKGKERIYKEGIRLTRRKAQHVTYWTTIQGLSRHARL